MKKKLTPKHGPVAANFKTLREAAGLTQEEIAAKFNVSLSTWRSYEQDRAAPGVKLTAALCNYFGITKDALFKALIAKSDLDITGRVKSALEVENEYLKRENELLRGMLEMLKSKR